MTTTPAAPARYNTDEHTLGFVTLKNGQTRPAFAGRRNGDNTGTAYLHAFNARGHYLKMTAELAATYVVVGPQCSGLDVYLDHTRALAEDAERTAVTPEQAAIADERAQLTDAELAYADQRAAALADDSDDELEAGGDTPVVDTPDRETIDLILGRLAAGTAPRWSLLGMRDRLARLLEQAHDDALDEDLREHRRTARYTADDIATLFGLTEGTVDRILTDLNPAELPHAGRGHYPAALVSYLRPAWRTAAREQGLGATARNIAAR